jgi:hypothetical protein
MTCRCHLCEPWNELARQALDANSLNELRARRLAQHGLSPKVERRFPPPSPQPVRLSPFADSIWKTQEEARLREYLRQHMERARNGHERTAGEGSGEGA